MAQGINSKSIPLTRFFQGVARLMLELLFPVFCLCCGQEGSHICARCFAHIPLQSEQVCPGCYQPSTRGAFCAACRAKGGGGTFSHGGKGGTAPGGDNGNTAPFHSAALDGLLTVCQYKDTEHPDEENSALIARLIHALKYEFSRELSAPLGDLLAGVYTASGSENLGASVAGTSAADASRATGEVSAAEQNPGTVILCPVPLHPKRLKWRGYNQAELLAHRMAEKTGLPVHNLLRRTRFKKAQKELGRKERLKNVEGAFVCAEPEGRSAIPTVSDRPSDGTRQRESGITIFLVDDVATTLATLESCAKALKEAGALRVYGIVLARAY